jgi:hypothetical protein
MFYMIRIDFDTGVHKNLLGNICFAELIAVIVLCYLGGKWNLCLYFPRSLPSFDENWYRDLYMKLFSNSCFVKISTEQTILFLMGMNGITLNACNVKSRVILKVEKALVKSVCCIRVLHLKAFTLTEAYHGACCRKL